MKKYSGRKSRDTAPLKSDCERFALLALFPFLCPRVNRSRCSSICCSFLKSHRIYLLLGKSASLFCSHKTSHSLEKPKRKFPTLYSTDPLKFIFSKYHRGYKSQSNYKFAGLLIHAHKISNSQQIICGLKGLFLTNLCSTCEKVWIKKSYNC